MLCPQLVLRSVHSIMSATLSLWQSAAFNDVEVAIRLVGLKTFTTSKFYSQIQGICNYAQFLGTLH